MSDQFIQTLISEAYEVSKKDPSNRLKTHALKSAQDLISKSDPSTPESVNSHMAVLTLLIAEQDDRHMRNCPFVAHQSKKGGRISSAFSVKWGDKAFDLTGPVAFVAILILGLIGFVWIRNSTRAEIRETVHSAMSLSSVSAPWEANAPEQETRQ